MSAEAVCCIIKPPVALHIADTLPESSLPGVYVTDLNLGKPANIVEISFKNYYTAFVTVRLQRMEKGCVKWVTCLRNHRLMTDPHAEAGSHDYFSIYREQMLTEPDNVVTVRLILRQPSSQWLQFNLQDIHVYRRVKQDSEKDASAWLSTLTPANAPFDLNRVPDPDTVSSSIQQMWALTEIMQAGQTPSSIGRFDVEGSYDVKSLSYT